MGGLSKKAFLLKGLVAEPRYPALVVNSGNLLFKTDALAAGDLEAGKIAADGIVQATRMMGGTLAGIGTRDLAAGAAFLRQYQQPPAFTWLSLNLVDATTNKPLFPPALLRQVGGVKLAILALTDHTAAVPGQTGEFRLRPWQDSLQEALDKVQKEADVILLLSNYSLPENQEIARKFGAIDLILQAGHSVGNMTPLVIDKTLITQAETRGKYVGVLDIDWNGHGRWNEGVTYTNRFIALKLSMGNDPEVETLVQQTQRRLDTIQPTRAH